MKTIPCPLKSLLIAIGFSILSGNAIAQENDSDIVAKVGSAQITRGQLKIAEQELGGQFQRVLPEQRQAAVLNTLIDFHILAQEAKKSGLNEDPSFKSRIDLLQTRTLHDFYFRNTVVNKIGEDEITEQYNKQIEPLKGQTEVRARHILTKTKEDAMEVIELLNRGADFAETAREKSTGPSGPQGGDLGFFGKGRMVPAFEEAAFQLEAGDYSTDPVETQFGFHVIKVEEKRSAPVPAIEELGPRIRQQILQQRYVALIQELRTKTQVEILDEK